MRQGDFLVVQDTGANTLSTFSRHCSRQQPAVYGYASSGTGFEIRLLKAKETIDEVLGGWGFKL